MPQRRNDVAYFIVCGGQPAEEAADMVPLLQDNGWDVCVITTPQGMKFIDRKRIEKLVNYPIRDDYKWPGDADVLPPANAIVVAPLTFNSLSKWVLGVSDTLAVSLLCEYLGLEVPIVAAPNVNPALARHPQMRRHIEWLHDLGVQVLFDASAPPPTWMADWSAIAHCLGQPA